MHCIRRASHTREHQTIHNPSCGLHVGHPPTHVDMLLHWDCTCHCTSHSKWNVTAPVTASGLCTFLGCWCFRCPLCVLQWCWAACRPSGGLHSHRHHSPLQAHARLQCAAPNGLGRIWAASRAVRAADRHTPSSHNTEEHRQASAEVCCGVEPVHGRGRQ